MHNKKRTVIVVFLLIVSIGNYVSKAENNNVTAMQFLSIFAIGALTAILIRDIVGFFTQPKAEK